MTQDEIIRMAREAGLQHIPIDLDYPVIGKAIERFAALVAAHERERTKDLTDDEIEAIHGCPPAEWVRRFARAVIAADREKNK